MTYSSLREFAIEVEIWTSLAINLWLILGGLRLLVLKIVRKIQINREAVVQALAWSFLILILTASVLAVAFFVVNGLYQRFLVGFWDGLVLTVVVVLIALGAVAGLIAERKSN